MWKGILEMLATDANGRKYVYRTLSAIGHMRRWCHPIADVGSALLIDYSDISEFHDIDDHKFTDFTNLQVEVRAPTFSMPLVSFEGEGQDGARLLSHLLEKIIV